MKEPTSEERYGLPAQPKNTCPIVDDGLRALKTLGYQGPDRYTKRRIDNADPDDLRGIIYDILSDIESDSGNTSDIEDALESCRQQAVELREWGQAWKDLAKENLDKVEAVETPWDGVMLWWREKAEDRWRRTWVYRTCFAPREPLHSKRPVPIII